MKKYIYFGFLLCVVANNAMENNLIKITSEKDAALFVGKVVAFDMPLSFDSFNGNIGCDPSCYEHIVDYSLYSKYGYSEDTRTRNWQERKRILSFSNLSFSSRQDSFLLFPDVIENRLYIKYGYLEYNTIDSSWPDRNGYILHILLNKNSFSNASDVLRQGRFRAGLSMRNITKEEAQHIGFMLAWGKAKFSHWDKQKSLMPEILACIEQVKK